MNFRPERIRLRDPVKYPAWTAEMTLGECPTGMRRPRLRDVEKLVGLKSSQIYRLIERGLLPAPVPLTKGARRWLAYDFDVGRRLHNLENLTGVGFAANRRLLRVQRVSHDAAIGANVLEELNRPRVVDRQRASALRFADPRVQALLAAVAAFRLLPAGFDNRQLRETLAPLLGMTVDQYGPGRMTYDLRRLRLHGLIERIPHTRRYALTDTGVRVALCYHRVFVRVLRPALSQAIDQPAASTSPLNRVIHRFEREIQRLWEGIPLAA